MFATVKTLDCVSSWPVPAVRWRGMRSRGGGGNEGLAHMI